MPARDTAGLRRRRSRRFWFGVLYTVLIFGGGAALGFWLGRTHGLRLGYAAGRLVEKTR